EEALDRRAGLDRRIVLAGAVVLRPLVADRDLHRDDRRLHALDNVGKADRLLDLADLVVHLRMGARGEQVDRTARGAETIDGGAEAGDDGSLQREFAQRKHPALRRLVRWKGGKVDGAFSHPGKSPTEVKIRRCGLKHLTRANMGISALQRAGEGVKFL